MPCCSLMAAMVSAKVMPAGDGALEEEPDHLALAALDLLPDDDAHAVPVRELARLQAAGGAVVVGDRDHVETHLPGALEDVGDRHHAVLAVMRVDVEVGEQLALLAAAARQRVPPPARHLVVHLEDLAGDALPVVPAGGAQRVRRQALAQLVVAEQARERRRQRADVARRDEQSRALVEHDLVVPGDLRGDDRRAGGHRLEQGDPGRLGAERRRAEDVRVAQERRHLRLRQAPVEAHPVLPARRHQARVAALLEVAAADVDDDAGVLVAEQAQGAQQHAEPLASLDAGAEDHAERSRSANVRRAEDLVVDAGRDRPGRRRGTSSAAASRTAADEAMAASSESNRRRSCGRVDQNGRIFSGLAWNVATSGQPA